MNANHYKTLARFFGNAAHVNVEFIDGATPATNGKIITLPNDLNERSAARTLAALLHETAHVARTDFAASNDTTPAVFSALNVLEDIRIDTATLAEYPNAQQLQQRLIDDVIARKRDELQHEQQPQQLLKGLILRANNFDTATLYSEHVNKIIDELTPFIDKARAAQNTAALIDDARELARRVMLADEQKPQGTERGSGAGNGDGNEQNGEHEQNEQNGQGSGGQNSGNEYSKASDDAKTAAKARTAAHERGKAADQTARDALAEYKTARRKERLNETKQRKAERDARIAAQNGDAAAAADADSKAQNYKKRSDAAADQRNVASGKISAARKEYNAARTDEYNASDEQNAAQTIMAKHEKSAFGNGCGIKLNGFDALDASTLTAAADTDTDDAAIDGRATLDDRIKDAFIQRREHDSTDDSGSKINTARLAELAAGIDGDDVFLTTDDAEHKTRAAFIIDGSGSMHNYGSEYTRATLAVNAAAALMDAAQRAIDGGAPLDFNVWAFGGNALKLIDSANEYSRAVLINKYNDVRRNWTLDTSSSNLTDAVNAAAAELREHGNDDARIIIIITDANIGSQQLTELRNGVMLDGERVLFIGADINNLNTDAAALFGDNNITDSKNALDILTRALLDAAK